MIPVLGGDVVEGDLSVGDGDEALEDGRLEVGEDEAAAGGLLVLAIAARDVAHHGRQRSEQYVSGCEAKRRARFGECTFIQLTVNLWLVAEHTGNRL